MKEQDKVKVPIEIEYIGENKMFFHIQWGEGKLGKKTIRLLQVDPSTLIFQVWKNKHTTKCFKITADSITKSFVEGLGKFEK